MSRMAELHAAGVTDLLSYDQGRQDEQARILKIVESGKWVQESLVVDRANLARSIKSQNND